jgi:hypothetical protein
MLKVQNIPSEKLSDKASGTFEDRLTTVFRELGHPISAEKVRECICRGFERTFKMSAVHQPFTAIEQEQIRKLEQEKYLSDGWVFQRIPAPDMSGESMRKTPAGLVRAYVALAGEVMKSTLITGDFFSGQHVIYDIEAALKWGRAERDSIVRTVKVVMANNGSPIQGISPETLADIIYAAVVNAQDHKPL